MMRQIFKNALLVTLIGSVMFLFSCNDDDDAIAAPEASFTAVVDGADVTLTNTSTGQNNTYSWSFGDGTNSSVESPTKTYTTAGDFTITLTATNDGGSDEASETITISAGAVDTDGPVITLLGDAAVSIEIGEDYTDAGATANDNVDGDVTADIVVTGEVNTIKPGEYTLAYNVSDAAGNAATEVTRTVTVTFDDGLLTNGDFETGDGSGWIGNALDVRTEGGNSYAFANVTSAGNSFDVNISQVVPMGVGNTYRLSFNASSDVSRTIIAGIGLNEAPFTNVTETVNITTTEQRFTYELTANFGSDNSRILFDMGADVGVVVIDNVSLELVSEYSVGLPIDFETTDVISSAFNGAAFAFAEDPADASNQVGKITNIGAAWEGVTLSLGTDIDLSSEKQISIQFNTATANVPVLLKLEGAAPVELTATAATTGWQELTFDFSSASGIYNGITIFVDGPGTTAGDFYIDDIIQEASSGGGSQGGCTGTLVAASAIPVDFEGCETFLASQNFGAGISSEIVANPFPGGINTSSYVLKVDKSNGADFYAGIQNSFANPLDFTSDVLKLKVYSTKANVVFRFELALDPQTDPVTGNPAPQFATIANANEWTEVEVAFSGFPATPATYNQLVIKPDNDQSDSPITSDGTYYIDDITTGPATGGGGNGAANSVYCNTEVKHLGIAAETASAINLTIVNVDATSMKVTISSADGDPVDDLIVNNLTGPITGSPTPSSLDTSVAGEISMTLTWNGGAPPADVELNVLWSKASFGGNWQLGTENKTVSFNQTCN